jgi:NAD(P) transhydrogenase subunit alpha
MLAAVAAETFPGERRVALVPGDLSRLGRRGIQVLVQAGAGSRAGYADADYRAQGATVVAGRAELFERAETVLQVRGLGANPAGAEQDLRLLRPSQVLAGLMDPLGRPRLVAAASEQGLSVFALELIPRITRAQSLDGLSSMASVAGYRAVLVAALRLPKLFPMMMTAAGTISPARVFVLGAGVAGLQAIATAKRLGAVVSAYDVRPEVKEQVESVGGRFVSLGLETAEASGAGGYARAQSQQFYRRQQERMADTVRASDVVITTAAVPGRPAPKLVSQAMVEQMRAGSVLVDLAAETGGNCELTRAGAEIEHHGVWVLGPANVPSDLPYHSSQLYSRNLTSLLEHLSDQQGQLRFDLDDEITVATLVAHAGEIRSQRIRDSLNSSQESCS